MAATGDNFCDVQSIANNSYMTIRPASGEEAIISYITANGGGKVKVSHYDGTYESVFLDLSVAAGEGLPFPGHGFPITYDNYLRVQNVSGGTLVMSYAGVITKGSS